MQHGHKLGKSWSAKDGVVRRVKVSDEQVDIVNTEVLRGAELDRQYNLSQGEGLLPRNDSLEWRVHGGEVFLLKA